MAEVERILPRWVRQYIGLPFQLFGRDRAGLDCWGLIALVLREQFGRDVPVYGEHYADHMKDLAGMEDYISRQLPDWRVVETHEPGDVVLLRIRRHASHCGVMVAGDWFLHVHEGINAVVEPIGGAYWKRDRHVAGFYRWEGGALENRHAI